MDTAKTEHDKQWSEVINEMNKTVDAVAQTNALLQQCNEGGTPVLPSDPAARKAIPVYSGLIRYFPHALAAVAALSQRGNDQHNPGKPLHWDRSKSGDELDAMMRHLLEEDYIAVAWRALAHLEKTLE